MTTTCPRLIETHHRTGAYDMRREDAIVDHPRHGRLLVSQGFGGHGVQGGRYRWEHGVVCRLQPNDTLESLHVERWSDLASRYEAVLHGDDDTRPMLTWDGTAIARMMDAMASRRGIIDGQRQ